MSGLSKAFFELFAGLDRAHGIYDVKGEHAKGAKALGSVQTYRIGPTQDHWREHLEGKHGLGIIPIRDDQTVRFAAIDIDAYDGLDLMGLANKVMTLELPLVVCRSKSGGAHVYLFCREDVPAELARGKMMEWAIALGYSGVEVFPKQVRLAGLNDVGNWINMPYFGSDQTERYAVFDGKKLSPTAFLRLARNLAVTTDQLQKIKMASGEHDELLLEGPPCLQTLAQRGGIGKGQRNNGLFNLGVYLRKRYGEGEWGKHFDKYNQAFLSPPLGHKEVLAIEKSVNRKAYEYKCNDQPICEVCSKQICLTRRFGVGMGEGDPGVVFGQLVKIQTEPVTWIWDVNGARIELTTAELKDQGRFHTRSMEELNIWPMLLKAPNWAELVRKYLQTCEVVEVPDDAKPEGQAWFYLEQYCTGQVRARNRDELLFKKPWTDNGRVYFHGPHFYQYLTKQGIRVSPKMLWIWLKKGGAGTKFFHIKGKGVNVWYVPSFPEQTEGHDVPMMEDEEEM